MANPHRSSPPHSLKSRHPEAAQPRDKALGKRNVVQRTEEPAVGQREHHHGQGWTTPRPCSGGVPPLWGGMRGSAFVGEHGGVEHSTPTTDKPLCSRTWVVSLHRICFCSFSSTLQHRGKGQNLGVNRLDFGHGDQNNSRAEPNAGKRRGLA